jgi:glycosyltransferase involved in cell wall biosynthesis
MPAPLLSIVIPTFNESRDLPRCLASIANQDFDKNKFEVIIVDNYSTDDTLKVAQSFRKNISLRVILNPTKDAEVSKMRGFRSAKGNFFMYLDADMRFSHPSFLSEVLNPLIKNNSIAGTFLKFLVDPAQTPLTRTLSYDEWQRDPVFKPFTSGSEEIISEKKNGFFLCKISSKNIPPQGLLIYRRKLVAPLVKKSPQLIDNDVPALLVGAGHTTFAYVETSGVYHDLLRSLSELWRKRIRNLRRTYFPNQQKRVYRWIDWSEKWPLVVLWLLYTHSVIFPVLVSFYKCAKYRDICFLNEPILNFISVYAIGWAFITQRIQKNNG